MFNISDYEKLEAFLKSVNSEQSKILMSILKRSDDFKNIDYEICLEIFIRKNQDVKFLNDFRDFLWNQIFKL